MRMGVAIGLLPADGGEGTAAPGLRAEGRLRRPMLNDEF